jgi:hypothetical protein
MAKKATPKAKTNESKTVSAKPKARVRRKTTVKAKSPRFQEKAPEIYVFWCNDGRKFYDMRELAQGLAEMSDETYAYHVTRERNDFCSWVRDIILDTELADELYLASERATAAQCVADRLDYLLSEFD